jgi:glucose-1-phosphate thymidylyltransferase
MNKFIDHSIILASGVGSRLRPLTFALSKQMLPIDHHFVIDYPINTVRHLGVKDLTVIVGCEHFQQPIAHLRSGSHLGLDIRYIYQDEPNGISAAINQCASSIHGTMAVCLGDNVFEKPLPWNNLDPSKHNPYAARIMLAQHPDLHRFGVASIKNGKIVSIVEKPKELPADLQHFAITGAYLFPVSFFEHFKKTKPSKRGEFEVCDILNAYLAEGLLEFDVVDGFWRDAGSHESIAEVRELIKTNPVEFVK